MRHQPSPGLAGAVQARLADLHRRKAALDTLIRCLEDYLQAAEQGLPEIRNGTEQIRNSTAQPA